MKKPLFACLLPVLAITTVQAQQPVARRPDSAVLFSKLTKRAVDSADAKAMYTMGIMYQNGLPNASRPNYLLAVEWLTKAYQAGNTHACYNLGITYKKMQDYATAYQWFAKGAPADAMCAYEQACQLYKGLGCKQSYTAAIAIFSVLARTPGNTAGISMRYLADSYYFGYGVPASLDSARYWLKAVAGKETAGKPAADPVSVLPARKNRLYSQLKECENGWLAPLVKTHRKIQNDVTLADIAGIYTGYLLQYDWSGQQLRSATPVQLEIANRDGGWDWLWKEGDSVTLSFTATLNTNAVVFGNMQFPVATSRYLPKKIVFRQASLQLGQHGEETYLLGDIQQFITTINEPGSPQMLALVRNTAGAPAIAGNVKLTTYPNPFGSTTTMKFYLPETCTVSASLLTADGKTVYTSQLGQLTAGSYALPLQVPKHLSRGAYLLQLHYGSATTSTRVVKQ